MNELTIAQPTVSYNAATCVYDFTEMDNNITELEKRFVGLVATDRKEAKDICAQLNKLKKAVNDQGIRIEKEATTEVKAFRKALKERTERIDAIREPLWQQVKPQPKKKTKEPKKIITRVLMLTGDEEYIDQMIATAEFAGIEVKEVIMNG